MAAVFPAAQLFHAVAASADAPCPSLGWLRIAAVEVNTVEAILLGEVEMVVEDEARTERGRNLPDELFCLLACSSRLAYVY